jgi:drug/metabolite transporter (DMT)-like permease
MALGYTACAAAGALWGTGFFWGRLALDEMSVEHMLLYRFGFASLGMLPVLWFHRRPARFSRRDLGVLLLSTLLGIPVQFLLQFHGLALTTVSHASLMVGAFPVMLAAGAALFAGERMDGFGWLALGVSTLGAGLIVSGSDRPAASSGGPSMAGDLLVLASLVTALVWILLGKHLVMRHGPLTVTAYSILSGFAMLAAWVLLAPLTPGLAAHPHFVAPPFVHLSPTAWVALATSGLACTATTTLLWNWGIHHVPASRAGVFLNLEPALGAWLGMQFLGERLSGWAWAGGGLILASAVALTTRGMKAEPEVILE